MPLEFIDVPWTFDKEGFHEDVKAFCKKHSLTQGEAFGMLGLSPSFSQPKTKAEGPMIGNLLKVCNFMDLNPCSYIVLKDY